MDLDPRSIVRGYNGVLSLSPSGEELANINTWRAQVSYQNSDFQPAGSSLSVAILQAVSIRLTFTETVISDAKLLFKLMSLLQLDRQPNYSFTGTIEGNDGTAGRFFFGKCVPDGDIDIANVQPGQEIQREWNFRVNEKPQLLTMLGPVSPTDLVDNFSDLIV